LTSPIIFERILFMSRIENGSQGYSEEFINKQEIKKNIKLAGLGVAGIIGGLILIIGDGKYLNPIRAYLGIEAALIGTMLLRNSAESISELKAASKKGKESGSEIKKG
jgi:hypothetical protein